MRHLVPHAVILLVFLAWAYGPLPESAYIGAFITAHLAAPIWSALLSRADARASAFWRGPGSLIAIHAALLVLCLLLTGGGFPVGFILMSWAIGLVAYSLYCLVAFALVTYVRRL